MAVFGQTTSQAHVSLRRAAGREGGHGAGGRDGLRSLLRGSASRNGTGRERIVRSFSRSSYRDPGVKALSP